MPCRFELHKMIFDIVALFYIFLQVGLYEFVPRLDPLCGIVSLSVFFVLLYLYYKVGARRDSVLYNSWLRPTYLLLISLLIVNFQSILNALMGLAPIEAYLKSSSYSSCAGSVLSLSLACTTSFLIGSNLVVKPFKFRNTRRVNSALSLKIWTLLSIVFFILFVAHINLYSFLSGIDYENSGAADRVASTSSYYEQLFNTAMIVVLAIFSNSMCCIKHLSLLAYIRKMPKMFLVVSCLYILLRMLSGDRGPVIYTICAFLYSYLLVSKKHIKLRYVIVMLLFGSIGITLLGIARDLDKDMDFTKRIQTAATEIHSSDAVPSLSNVTQELANSVNCTFISVYDIKNEKVQFRYGEYSLFSLIGSIPGSSFVLTKFFGVNLREKMSSEYITTSYFGKYYPLGLGTSAVADFYLDFGILGAIIMFFFMGVFYRKIDYEYVYNQLGPLTVVWTIIILKISSLAIYTPRSSFASTFSSALYIAIIYYVINIFLSKISAVK